MKKVWNKFLELKTSPTFMLVALIGLVDLLFWFFYFAANTYMVYINEPEIIGSYCIILPALILLCYMGLRIAGLKNYIFVFVVLFFLEKIFKIKIKNNFVENNSIYITLWAIGIVTFVVTTLNVPFLKDTLK